MGVTLIDKKTFKRKPERFYSLAFEIYISQTLEHPKIQLPLSISHHASL